MTERSCTCPNNCFIHENEMVSLGDLIHCREYVGVEEYNKVVDSWKFWLAQAETYMKERDKLITITNNLATALAFYAKIEHWGNGGTEIDPCDREEIAGYGVRGGRKARKVLSVITEVFNENRK